MRPTRRWWEFVGVGAVLLAVALLGERVVPLVGASAIGAYLLASAVRAVWSFSGTNDTLSVSTDVTPASVPVSGSVELSLTAGLADPATHPVSINASFPPGVEQNARTLVLEVGQTRASDDFSPQFPVAGRFSFPDLNCVFTSADGLYEERMPLDEHADVTVRAPDVGELYVGTGSERRQRTVGSHRGEEQTVSGEELSSIREYQPGDKIRHIDWKASARLDDLFVREYEDQHERTIHLVVDARLQLPRDRRGQTQIDFLREIALSHLRTARQGEDPCALTVIDDAGLHVDTAVAKTDDHYGRLERHLSALEADSDGQSLGGYVNDHTGAGASEGASGRSQTGMTDSQAQATAARKLGKRASQATEEPPFTEILSPFFERSGGYIDQLGDDPLFKTLRRRAKEHSLEQLTVLLTDDADRGLIRETTRLVTQDGGSATVFVAPNVLFERWPTDESEAAYQSYVEFEEFRRELERIPRVAAYEVAPDDRLRDVLAQGRTRGENR